MKGLITNEWDRDNLNFLLNTKGDEFKVWFAQADEDDKAYAQELMLAAQLISIAYDAVVHEEVRMI